MTKTFSYRAIAVQQTPESRPFYVTACPAEEILEWCDVPRKKEEFMAGYQRDLQQRHETIKDFFETDPQNNIIPNAAIIALRPGRCTIKDTGDGTVSIEIVQDDKTFDEKLKEVLDHFKSRLNQEELDSISEDENTDGDTSADEQAIDEAVPPQSYMSVLTAELEKASKDYASISPGFKNALEEYIDGVTKSGLIIDGQHRIFGAKNVSAFEVNLPIVLMPDIGFEEQVFHFYVINNKAKPLSATELRTIVSTSLSKGEIEQLYDRFKQVGVTAEQTEWTYRMNTDAQSPFQGIINLGLPGSKGVIPENVAYQLASRFLKPSRKYRLLYEKVPEWDGPDRWNFRLSLFFALWRAVRDQYPNAWEDASKGGNRQILQKVSLLILQEYILDTLNAEMPKKKAKGEQSPFSDPSVLEEETGYTLPFLKEEFFTKTWKAKGLDTKTGHDIFRDALQTAVSNQSANLGNIKLFKDAAA